MPLNSDSPFVNQDERYLNMFEIIPTGFIQEWRSGHYTTDDPFGQRTPDDNMKIAMSRAFEGRMRPENGIRGELGVINPLAGRTTTTAAGNSPLTYEDLRRTQQAMMANQMVNGGTTRRNKYDLNREFRMYLKEYFPEEEAFLYELRTELNMDPIDTLIECIRVAMSSKAVDSNVLNDINYELMRLEKEKRNGKLDR